MWFSAIICYYMAKYEKFFLRWLLISKRETPTFQYHSGHFLSIQHSEIVIPYHSMISIIRHFFSNITLFQKSHCLRYLRFAFLFSFSHSYRLELYNDTNFIISYHYIVLFHHSKLVVSYGDWRFCVTPIPCVYPQANLVKMNSFEWKKLVKCYKFVIYNN